MKKKIIYSVIFLILSLFIITPRETSAQENKNQSENNADRPLNTAGAVFSFYPGEDFKIIKKFNLRIKKDSRYAGSVFREYRQLCRMSDNIKNGAEYSGSTFVFEEQKREGRLNAKRVDNVSDTDFTFYFDGKIKPGRESIYPLLRDFPVFPGGKKLVPGDKWQDYGDFFVDPLKKGLFTKVRFLCEYRYDGIKDFNGKSVHAVYAQYAVRYRQGDEPEGDFDLKNVSGSHKGMIYIGEQMEAFDPRYTS